ncbi:MAG: DUF4956 domain-containing protein [Burkholderiales bacterium]
MGGGYDVNLAAELIRKSILDDFAFTTDLSFTDVIIALGLAFVIGIFIYIIYRLTFGGVIYSKSLGTSLVMITMVTTMVIMPITTNLIAALGMVGALSIVRFRTAVKEMLDTIYMFWAIAAGITLGTRLYIVALIASGVIGVLMLIWNLFKSKKNFPYMLVLRFDESVKKEVQNVLRKLPQGRLKSKVVSQGTMELTIEMNIKESEVGMIDAFSAIPGVHDASLISYKGDIVA